MEVKDNIKNVSWNIDLYNKSLSHRKILLILTFILSISIIVCLIWMQMIISKNKIEPFVIEIDKKTGIATTVKPVEIEEYSANTAVLRSLVISYIRAREEYIYQLYNKNYGQVVKVFSSPVVYRQYTDQYSINNPNSPYNTLGKNGTIDVKWKSIIFPQTNTAQIRISLNIQGGNNFSKQTDKIILMSFEFTPDNNISESDRLLNPLGFTVTMYKIEDENPNI